MLRANPPRDRSVSDAVENDIVALSNPEIEILAAGDEALFRNREGRDVGNERVFDMVSLDARWEAWFARIENDRDGLNAEIEQVAEQEGQSLANQGYQWTNIDWPVVGRMIGSSILARLYDENILSRDNSTEIYNSRHVWIELSREVDSLGLSMDDPIPLENVNSTLQHLIQSTRTRRSIDPIAEISRNPEGPSKPLTNDGGFIRINPNVERVRNRIRARYQLRGEEEAIPQETLLGILCLEVIDGALDELANGNYAEFALTMHGIVAYMVQRGRSIAQRVGMHLISSLLVRKEIRSVNNLLLCDIANQLDTAFPIGRVLQTLTMYGIVRWNVVDCAVVEGAL